MGGGLLGWVATSLPFLSAVLGGGDYPTHVGFDSRNQQLQPVTQLLTKTILSEKAQQATRLFPRWLYLQSGDSETVAGVTLQETAGRVDGWNNASLGFVKTLSSSNQPIHISPTDLLHFIKDAALGNIDPIQPSLIAQLQDSDYGSIKVQAKSYNNEIRFTYVLPVGFPRLHFPSNGELQQPERMEVALPSAYLERIDIGIQNQIEDNVLSDLALTKSRPDLLDVLRSGELFGMLGLPHGEDGVARVQAIGTVGNQESIAGLMRGWVELERGYLSPTERAFRLPDGTIGLELIPSPNVGSGFSDPGHDGCRLSYIGAAPVWLCQRDGAVVLGTNGEAARALLTTLAGLQAAPAGDGQILWRVELPQTYAEIIATLFGLEGLEIRSLVAEGNAGSGRGVLWVR